jgi:membrane-associated protein
MRTELLSWLADHLVAFGPGVLFAVCLLETAVFAGLVLPVGALIAFSAMLAARGLMDPGLIAVAALGGAFLGDQAGFAVGRWFVSAARPRGGGRIVRVWRGALSRTERLIRRHGLLGVSAARAIPFVRTLMPWFAGRSRVPWGRFLAFDALGILLWGAIYLGGGFLVGEGWRQIAAEYGEPVGLVAILMLVLAFLALVRRPLRQMIARRTDPGRGAPPTAPRDAD